MHSRVKEWLLQANDELDSAKTIFNVGRYVFAAFLCHLAAEKTIKALYDHKLGEIPPKTHNLLRLVELADITLSKEQRMLCVQLVGAMIEARYPDDLKTVKKTYSHDVVKQLIVDTEDLMKCLQKMFETP